MKSKVLQKFLSVFCSTLILSSSFQTYVFANGISKVTEKIYTSKIENQPKQKAYAAVNTAQTDIQTPSVASQGGGVVSDAYNFKDLSKSVDPRTGAFSVSYKVADVVGNGLEDPAIPLSLNYSSLSRSDRFSLGKGWAWNLSYYDSKTNMLSLSSGGSYKLDLSKGSLKYYKLNDLKVEIGSIFITIKYKDGREEKIDRAYGNLISVTNIEGYIANLKYINGNLLQSISYKNINNDLEIKKLDISYPNGNVIFIKVNNGTNSLPTTILSKTSKSNLLSSIKNPLSQEISFSYSNSNEKDFPTDSLITKVSFPTGTNISVTYLDGGLNTPLDGVSFPAVKKIETNIFTLKKGVNNKLANNSETISYFYSQGTNYLGKGFGGFKEGEDALFYTPNTYTYSSVESKDAPNGSNIKIERTYNHYHQLINEKLKENDNLLQLKEYTYPDWTNKNFVFLDANYNFPIEIKTTYYANGMNRSETIKNTFDFSGNKLKSIETNGLIKEYQYLKAENTFNGIVHLLERETQTSKNDNISLITEYKYETAKNLFGKSFQRLKGKIYKYSNRVCNIADDNCGTVYKTEINSFLENDSTSEPKIYSLPASTKIWAASAGKCKVLIKKNTFAFNANFNILTKELVDGSGAILAKETSKVNSFSKYEENRIESNGKNISYQYDSIGRVTKEIVKGYNSNNSITTSYLYFINDNSYGLGYGTSSVLVINPNGYSTYKVNDSLGREIKTYLQSKTDINFNLVSSYSYNSTGQKDSQTLFDIDKDGNKYQVSSNFRYDVLGRETIVISQSGESKVTNYDDASNKLESYMISSTGDLSPITVTYYDLNKKPIKIELLTQDRTLYSKSTSLFDGFGNLIEAVDVNRNKVKFVYSPLGQKMQDIFLDNRKISYAYDPLFDDKVISKSVITPDGKEYVLGSREYDSVGQLISESDSFGKSIKYTYDINGNVKSKLLRSGKEIKYTYNEFNKLTKKEVVGEETKYTVVYEYDAMSLYLVSMTDSTGKTKYETYKDGQLKSLTYPDNKSIKYEYNFQNILVKLTDINGLKTNYLFDVSNGRLNRVQFVSSTNSYLEEHFIYDNFGRVSGKILPNNYKINYSYNSMGGLNHLSYIGENGLPILSYEYNYNIDMNIASRIRYDSNINNAESQENYKYDEYNNLQKYSCSGVVCPRDSNGNPIKSEEYTFDYLNNIRTAKVIYSNEIKESLTSYEYSKVDGIRLERYTTTGVINSQNTLEYDADGNIIKDGDENRLTYTPFQRLSSFLSKNNKATEYLYNGSGEIVSQSDSVNGTVKFYYNGSKILNESLNGSIISYLQINGNIVGKVNPSGVSQFYLTDQAKSVIRIIEGNKLLTQNFVYTPYGQQSDLSNSGTNPKLSGIGFNGERTDSKTGYQFLGKGYRAYNPALGRFMQYDIKSPFGKGGINGYIFAENNPIMKFDPTGENAANVMLGVGLGLSILGIFLSIFTLGTTLAPAIAGTAAITAADVAVTVSATAGLASSVIGITGQVYGKLAGDAAAAGNKAGASKYGDISYALGWTSFALGMASTAVGVGLEVSGAIGAKTAAEAARTATRETTINLSQAANKLNKNYLADIYDIGIRKSSQFKVTKQIMGYTGDITWAAGKGFGEASRNEAKSGDNEKSEIYGKIATGIFWISLGAGYFSVGMSTMKTPFAFKETSDKLFPQAAE